MTLGIDTKYQAMSLNELLSECQRLHEKVQYLEQTVLSHQNVSEQYQFTQFAIDNLVMGAMWVTEDASITYVNKAACKMLGYSKDELLSMRMTDIKSNLTSEKWPNLWKKFKDTDHQLLESTFATQSGTPLPVELAVDSVVFQGIQFHCIFIRDTSKEREAKQALEDQFKFNDDLIEAASAMVLVLDLRGDIIRFNTQTAQALGRSGEDLTGQCFSGLFDDETQSQIDDFVTKSLTDQARPLITEIVLPNRGSRSFIWHARLLKKSDHAIFGLLVNGQDITESREREIRICQAEKMSAIALLTSGLAGRFNNTIGPISEYADLLLGDLKDAPHLSAYVQKIRHAAKQATKMTEQLLTFSKKGTILSQPLDLNTIIETIIENLQQETPHIILKHRSTVSQAMVNGDVDQLEHAVLNLATNAADAMADGGTMTFETQSISVDPRFEATHGISLPYGPYIQLTVSDTGIGIPKEIENRIFEPFFTTKGKKENSGMGLATVFNTISNHNGAVMVSSESGKGTTFALFLPCSETIPLKETNIMKTVFPSSNSIRVLLAEDEKILRQVAKEMLRRIGCEVTICTDGLEAVAQFEKQPYEFDVVIVDMNMPNLNGREAFLKMKQINPDIAVILSSGYALNHDVQDLIDYGAKGFIQKPFRKKELTLAVAEACGSIG